MALMKFDCAGVHESLVFRRTAIFQPHFDESPGNHARLRDRSSEMERPEVQISSLVITGSAVGAVLAVGLAVLTFVALPPAREFLMGAIALGVLVGLGLWWKHR